MLIHGARLVPGLGPSAATGAVLASGSIGELVDVRTVEGVIVEVAPRLGRQRGEDRVDADGRWLMPGLWDAHVHLTQWALRARRLDLSGATSAAHAVRIVADRLAGQDEPSLSSLTGWGHRSTAWPEPPTVAALDEVSGHLPVVLISGDAHHAWMNSRALQLLGLPPRTDPIAEREWFEIAPRLAELPGSAHDEDVGLREVTRQAAALGVVGITDLEFGPGYRHWPNRSGLTRLRVRTGVYPEYLDEVLSTGLGTGDQLDETGLVRLGPLKVISDGSLNTCTAWCHHPYAGSDQHGVSNYSRSELAELLRLAGRGGLQVAVHAIGDAALSQALDVIAETGTTGSIEHAQLIDRSDLARMATLNLTASVQPAHLVDDRDVAERLWPERVTDCFAFGSMARAGVRLALGSDAPVSPLDPWLAISAAVHRGHPDEPAWGAAESLTVAQALAASIDGRRIAAGQPADLVLLDDDPYAAELRTMPVAATLVAGEWTHSVL